MRMLISTLIGLGIGVLFLMDSLNWVAWCPAELFRILHLPSVFVTAALTRSEAAFWQALPYAPIGQWTILGALVGIVLQVKRLLRGGAGRPPGRISGLSM